MNSEFCICSEAEQKPEVRFGSKSFWCGACKLMIASEEKLRVEALNSGELTKIKKPLTLQDQIVEGNLAANRTITFATLFENIGRVMQTVSTVGALILLVSGLFLSGAWWIKVIYWVAILIIWAFSYVQTALVRGLASYFQMKASDHIIRYWKN